MLLTIEGVTVVIVRHFDGSHASDILVYGSSDSFDQIEQSELSETIIINLFLKGHDSDVITEISNKNGVVEFFVATQTNHADKILKRLFLERGITHVKRLLTNAELKVLRKNYSVSNARIAASELFISPRTYTNHLFNVTKKIGIPAPITAALIYDHSSAAVFIKMLKRPLLASTYVDPNMPQS